MVMTWGWFMTLGLSHYCVSNSKTQVWWFTMVYSWCDNQFFCIDTKQLLRSYCPGRCYWSSIQGPEWKLENGKLPLGHPLWATEPKVKNRKIHLLRCFFHVSLIFLMNHRGCVSTSSVASSLGALRAARMCPTETTSSPCLCRPGGVVEWVHGWVLSIWVWV